MKTHFEIHHTLQSNIAGLEGRLEELGIKLHRFTNIYPSGTFMDDVFTSQKLSEDGDVSLKSLISIANDDRYRLEKSLKVNIVRTKIELPPWSGLAAARIDGQYFETHMRVIGGQTASMMKLGLLPSVDKKKQHLLMTLRTRKSYAHHLGTLDELINDAASLRLPMMVIGDLETEFVAHDDNQERDAEWEGRQDAA